MCKISLKMKTLRCVKFLMKSRLLFLDFTDSKVLLYTHTIHFHKKNPFPEPQYIALC